MAKRKPTCKAILQGFITTIDRTGGVVENVNGTFEPVAADREWTDLGELYMLACEVLDLSPIVAWQKHMKAGR